MFDLIIQKKDLEDIWNFIDGAIEDIIIGKSRWHIQHEMIFKWTDGKVYRTQYQVGATENQDEKPWEHEDEIGCTEVVLQRHSGFEWVDKKNAITKMVEGDL